MPEELRYYTVEEAATRLGISQSTLRKWVSKGRIAHHKLGGRLVRFNDEDLTSAFRRVEPTPNASVRRRRRP
jgi:excisionase family DNA binding protein